MKRRGVSAIFAWIFIVFVGGLIIGLFYMIATTQVEQGSNRLAQNALQQVNTILNTQASSFDTSTTVRVPTHHIAFTCEAFENNGQVTLLSQLEIGGFSRVTHSDLLAAVDIQADQLILFSKEWRAPFRIGNVLHVSSPRELLIIKGDTIPNTWRGIIPDVVNVVEYSGEPIPAGSYQTVRVVTISSNAMDSNDFQNVVETPGQNTYYMHINYEDDVTARGTVTYYDPNSRLEVDYDYVGEAMLTGLLWQATPQQADCLQHKLVQELKKQTHLQEKRLENLDDIYTAQNNQACVGQLTRARLQELREAPQLRSSSPLYDLRQLHDKARDVERQNEGLLRGDRCATIY